MAHWIQIGAAGGDTLPAIGEGGYVGLLLRMIFYLGLICAAIYLILRFAMPRLFRLRLQGTGTMMIVDQIPIGAGKSVCLLKAVGKYYLMGVSEGGVRMLAELDREEVEALYPADEGGVGQKRSWRGWKAW